MRVDVAVTCDGGETFSGSCDGPPGIWGRPVPIERLEAKWRDCLAGAYGSARATTLHRNMMEIANSDTPSLLHLICALAQGSPE